ncbi:Adenylate cyclase [Hyalangium minutum]|uniref:Adenylate cyclase n=1 Tax=Hyalangium minutum TaxID=394096 RepID=A0A085WV67_9BACT|nr:Adenylate cyclase [Hyalangium minutum]
MDQEFIRVGTIFAGRYEILEKLGEGGFGQVFKARQLATLQVVAIKVLREVHSNNASHVARFQREMQLCAQLYHPHIVRLIDSGSTETGLLFSVFEYVPGQTLTQVLASEKALSAWETTQLMLQVLDALECAHRAKVVHRDLKPQNIMVSHTGVRRNALVLDFGLGTLPAESSEDLAKITQTQEVLGTPTYASPEQLRGEQVSPRSDLYSWGLIFLECLTGHRAVDGPTLQAIIFKQLGPEAIAIPAWLEHHRLGRLLRKVTAKNHELRDISALQLMRELEACAAEGWPVSGSMERTPTPAVLPSLSSFSSAGEGERRQLTAVCCSLRLSQEEGAALDEEDLDKLLRPLHATCAELARSYEGYVGGVLGESMLFYFGYPQAQEDDARRAARTALEMGVRMQQRAEELAREKKGRLEFRAGIHTGLVVIQEGQGGAGLPALMGSTPNAAVRLEGTARPGTLLVSEATSKLLRGHFAFEPVKDLSGASGPVFRVLHEYKKGHGSDVVQEGPLYGRAQELEFLQQRWTQVVGGNGQSILLTGEPGIGKSRLVQELIRQSRSTPHTTLDCRCMPEGRNSALSPWVDMLERWLGVGPGWTPEQKISALEALLSQHGFVLAEAMPLFLGLLSVKGGAERYPPPDVSPQRTKELTLDALLGLFFEVAQQQPLLLLVEDLHWADPTTMELLSQLVKDLSGAPICLILTARPEFTSQWSASHHLQLTRLDRKRVQEMVSGLTQDRNLPPEVMEKLLDRTDGVPLFVEELTRIIVESMPVKGETPSRSFTFSKIVIPTTLRDSLMARLDRLGPAKELAQLASALGREFSYEVLKSVSEREEPVLQHELKTLSDADLVHRRRTARNPIYVFKHALIRDTAYESMLKPLRRQVHARIASTLEAHFPELVETRPDLLAMHHSEAGQKRKAIGYAQKAGLGALMRSANQEAIAYITEAKGWLDVAEDPKEQAQLELGLNEVLTPALMATRGWSDAQIGQVVERSQHLIDLLGDSPKIIPTLWGLLIFYISRNERDRARVLVERLVGMAKHSGNLDLELMAEAAHGNNAIEEAHFQEAQQAFERALSLYKPAEHPKLAILYGQDGRSMSAGFLSVLKFLTGYPDQAEKLSTEAMAWAMETKHTSSIGLTYLYRMNMLHLRGDREAVLAVARAGEELLQRHGLPLHGAFCTLYKNWAERKAEPMRQILDMMAAGGLEIGKTHYHSLLADVEFEMGQVDAALARYDELVAYGRKVKEGYMLPSLLRAKGLCLRAKGEREAAEASVRQAIGVAREQGAKMMELRASVTLAEMQRDRGQRAEAYELLAPQPPRFTEGLDTPDLVRARALLAELKG